MIKLLIDTNIVLDLLAHREPFYKGAAGIFSLADKHKVILSVSALSFATCDYILSKSHPPQEVREILRRLKILANIFALNDKIIELALNDNAFEDVYSSTNNEHIRQLLRTCDEGYELAGSTDLR